MNNNKDFEAIANLRGYVRVAAVIFAILAIINIVKLSIHTQSVGFGENLDDMIYMVRILFYSILSGIGLNIALTDWKRNCE